MSSNVRVQVTTNKTGRSAGEGRVLALMAAVFGMLLLIGTFCDEVLAKALYMPHNVIATLVTTVGLYPFATSVVLFAGAAFERLMHGKNSQVVKVVGCIIMAVLALGVGFFGAAALVDVDCLGGILPMLNKNYVAIAVLSLVIEWPLFYVGWRLAGRSDDRLLLKRAVCLIVVLLAAFAFMQLTKGVFNRPRYRTVAVGYEGIGFVPWYHISPKPTDLMATYDLAANEFRSFPSGHAIMSISTVAIMLGLTWLVPALRQKRIVLCWAGFVFALVVMFTRMVLGAHYLSDVSAGALIGLLFVCVNWFLQRRLNTAAI